MSVPDIRPTERFDQGLLPMAAVSLDGTFVLVNDALCRLLARQRTALLGRPVGDVLPPSSRDDVKALLASAADGADGADGAQLRHEVSTGEGGTVPVLAAWTLVRDPQGRPSYLTAVLVDETERVRAERELAASEQRWRRLLTHAADVIWTGDADGTVTWTSPARSVGWSADDVLGRSAFSFVHEDDLPAYRAAWAALVAGEVPQQVLEYRFLRGDGAWVWVRETLTDLRADPTVGAVVGNLVDMTATRREQQERARHESRFRARFEQSLAPQAMVDLAGVLTDVNDAFCALVGRSRQELLGRCVAELRHPDEPRTAGRHLRDLLTGDDPAAQFERVLTTPDGEPVPVRIDATVLRDVDGSPLGVAGWVQDLRPLRESERRRALQEQFFAQLSARASDLALIGDADGRIVYASPAVQHVFGYDERDVVGLEGWGFVHPDDVAATRRAYQEVVDGGGTRTFVARVRAADGQWRWIEETATNLLETALGGVVCNLRDVTEQVLAEQALRASEGRYRAIVDTADEGIAVVALTGRPRYVNARLAAILGRTTDELRQMSLSALLGEDQAVFVAQRVAHRHERGTERYEVAYAHPDGSRRFLRVTATPLHDDGDEPLGLAMVSDVTEERRLEQELRHAALHDALTGLPNRALLLDRLGHALERETAGTAVLVIDLDHFKLVNDSRGHHVGDDLLVAVAARLRSAARPGDTVARFGGDEFVMVCEQVDEAQAQAVAHDVLAALADPVDVDDTPVHVRASIGVAVSPAASAGDLLRYADTAMYSAKAAGRGRARLFDRELAEQSEERFALAADLRQALEQDVLSLAYQPVVDLSSGAVVGMEALARWDHPDRGPVPPSSFVPVAELTGLAPQLDRWALRRALREAGALRDVGAVPADVEVAVNLSARNLGDTALEGVVAEASAAAGLRPEQVVLEITETAIMDDTAVAVELLGRLRARGFQIAIDDFGTGYSSLAYLRDLPITSLKVDRTFVQGIAEDSDALAIVASIVDLARTVGVRVVAEGVETAEQAAQLRRLGCTVAQGWLWSRAVPVDDVRAGAWTTGFAVPTDARSRAPRPTRAPLQVRSEHGRERLLALHCEGASLATIAAALNREGYRTPTGARWHRTSVARAVADSAYPALVDRG